MQFSVKHVTCGILQIFHNDKCAQAAGLNEC